MLARFDALVDRIYDTVASPPAWRATLTGIADALASSSGVLMGVSIPQQRVLWNHLGRYDPASARTFCDRHFHNPLMKVVPGRPAGDIVFVDEALPADRLRRTPFWDEVLHPYDIAHVAVVPLSTQPECLAAFNIFRSPAQGPFTSHDRSSLERLTPHMRRALQLQLRVEGYQQLVTGAFAALDQLAVGVVVLSGSGAVAFANRRARQMHAAGGPILLRDGTVVARGAAPSAALRRLIAGAVDGGPGGALQLEGAGPRDPAIAVVAPLRGRALQAVREEGMPQAGAVVFVSPRRAADLAPTVLAQLYGFSPAESRVALRIARGESIPAVAAALGLSINTVKTHTRQIFDKAGVRRQAEFCGALAPLQLFSAADREASSPA